MITLHRKKTDAAVTLKIGEIVAIQPKQSSSLVAINHGDTILEVRETAAQIGQKMLKSLITYDITDRSV